MGIVLHQRRSKKMLLPQWLLSGCLPGFWDVSSLFFFQLQSRDRNSCCVDVAGNGGYFLTKMQHKVTFIPKRFWPWFRVEESRDWFAIWQNECRVYCFPQNMCQLMKQNVNCQTFFRIDGQFDQCWGRDFWSERHRGVHFAFRLIF